METMKRKQLETALYSAAGVAVMFVILVGANIILGLAKTRVDLTAERSYTLSAGTRAILAKLDTPVKVRLYCTQGEAQMPIQLKNYARRVEDLLAEYRQASKGLIEIEKLDPQPDTEAEESASLDGVEGQSLNLTDRIFLGLSVSCLDIKESIPFLSPSRERLLEYDLTRALARVAKPERPVVGVMSALPVFGMPMNPMMMQMGQQGREPWVFISELRRDFTVKEVGMDLDKIDDEIKVLIVLYPKGISEKGQFAIDQFVLRGGKLIAFLDPLSIADSRSSQMNPMQRASASGASLDKLLKAWGVEFDMNKVVADMNFMIQLNRGGREEVAPAVMLLTQKGINDNDIVTGQIDSALIPYSGVFAGTPATGLSQSVLLKTSDRSQLIEKMMAEFAGENIVKSFSSSGKEMPLAIRLSGKFKTAFPDGKPADKPEPGADPKPEEKKEAPAADLLKESAKENTVILFADSDLLYDPVCVQVQNIFGQRIVQPQYGNLNLAQSLVEQMSGDDNLIAVRSRASLNRPFTVVKEMEAKAQESYRSKIKQLDDSLQETQTRLNELQRTKDKSQRSILSPEQQAEIAKFKKQEADAKRELRAVRKNLRSDIDSLESRVKWINIAGMPIVVALGGVGLALLKRKKTAAK
jgi:ABC-type uncharacterized transport system involved in gliding motility auxiliary subunit